jgi:hypothetical protein
MSNITDEKYRVTSLVNNLGKFTLTELRELLRENQLSDLAYIVISELLEKDFIEISYGETLVFKPETLSFDKKGVMIYKIIPEKRKELEELVAELDKQRWLPDDEGRPQGLSYRVLEQLIEDVVANPETLAEQETEINSYLALAQEEEMANLSSNLRQREISEAYIRVLYGKYLQLKPNWINAILQLLTASQIFNKYKLVSQQRGTEQHASEIFALKYHQAQGSVANHRIRDLLELQEGAEKIKQIISHEENQLYVFFSLVDQSMKEIKEATAKSQLERSAGVISRLASLLSTQLEVLAEQSPIGLRKSVLEPKRFSPTPYTIATPVNRSSPDREINAMYDFNAPLARGNNPISQTKENLFSFDLMAVLSSSV